MKPSDIFACAAAAALAVTPVAAQAGTRAGDAGLSIASGERLASPITEYLGLGNYNGDCDDDGILNDLDDTAGCGSALRWLLIGGAALALVSLLVASENDASPGTGG